MTDTSKDGMKVLQIDDKWSVHYDPKNNDRPEVVFRNGERHPVGPVMWNNDSVAMFYELLDAREKIAALSAQLEAANARARDDALVEAATAAALWHERHPKAKDVTAMQAGTYIMACIQSLRTQPTLTPRTGRIP